MHMTDVRPVIDPNTPRPYHLVGPDAKHGTWALVRVSDGGYLAHNFKSREEAEAKYAEWEAIGRCVECGDVLNDGYMDPYKEQIRREKMCFSCLHWIGYVRTVADRTHAIVGGYHYVISPDRQTGLGTLGHGGARFDIQFHDGREVVTHNLWAQGKVPARFRDRLPDNAVFVKRGTKAVSSLTPLGGGYVGPGSADASHGW